jgi:hypothetical protein
MRFKILVITSLISICGLSYAEPKKITCKEEFGQTWTVEFILDTDDFDKEAPQSEATLLNWDDKDGNSLTRILPAAVGRTYRHKYEVTPSTLSLEFQKMSSNPNNLPRYSVIGTMDINRKDLTTRSGSCSIEDYVTENVI